MGQFMIDRAPEEFGGLKKHILGILTNKAKLDAEFAKMAAWRKAMAKLDLEQERADFGSWMAEYLNDAGYSSWIVFPDVYKLMVMTAFPPLEELDNLVGHKK